MIYTIDSSNLDSIIGGAVGIGITAIIAAYKTCKSYGISWDLIKTKLIVRSDAARLIKHQDNDAVVTKLCLSDDLVQFLQSLAPNPDGTINEIDAMERIKACIAWQNILIQNENQKNRLKPLEMKK